MESKNKNNGKEKIVIHIDKKEFRAPKNPMTGRELKELGGVPTNYDLWHKIPGKDDQRVADDESVQLKNGDHFYSAPSTLNPGAY
jgi:hypothetical protein